MTALNVFIERNLPLDLRTTRDFTGSRGWVHLMNQLLRRFESEGLIALTQEKEVGVEVSNSYWITIPSDLRAVTKIYYPDNIERNYDHQIVNGKIKLDEVFEKKTDHDTFTLSSGSTSQISINDADAVADKYNLNLLVLLNGTYVGDSIIIGEHNAASGGVTVLPFLHARSTSVVTSTSGYITDTYLMLRYMATFTGLAAQGDNIPIDPKYETALISGISYLAKPVGSKERGAYREEFEYDLDVLRTEQFTPTPDQARPEPRPMAAYEYCEDYSKVTSEFLEEFE
jgi:hypothetical protein